MPSDYGRRENLELAGKSSANECTESPLQAFSMARSRRLALLEVVRSIQAHSLEGAPGTSIGTGTEVPGNSRPEVDLLHMPPRLP